LIAQAIVVYLFAFIAVIAAVMVISRDNPVHSALWLILNLVCLAVLYYTLQAPFLMAVQLIVYAGAIVVLFLFVVMLLSSKRQAGGAPGPLAWLSPASIVAALLLAVALLVVAISQPTGIAENAKEAVVGTPANVGLVLYRDYLLPFEATSILLLAALVGAMYLGRHSDKEELAEEETALRESRGDAMAGEAEAHIPEDIHV
jgi:NADH-quinone oxidoreductase subunit J